ncbi:flagellar hook-associated protein FlgK [Nocardioides sp. TRM66260-LWL]|uniref:flagellar hook-associated protein FlgK n=1 Tax=Nocardioides sp. TRM66260-LWL TaxID=2874478 RepID=UPI001CC6E3CF|nr:flagellar hook-associated protein FlgK [Nocardioides sp. TRM66260-LWL]MBZ5736154.1 flagellar hook-associated protein FlgK [Nocardioides sp. TRM66260-LWL]
MVGSFGSLNTALTALRYTQASLETASNNIANVTTEGYTRRRVLGEAIGAPSTPAQWSRFDGVGGGVSTKGVQRLNDDLLDARARTQYGTQQYLDVRATVLQRVETGIGEPGDNGVSAALADFRAAWHDLANDPGGSATRQTVLSSAVALTDSVHAQSRALEAETANQRSHLLSSVSEANTVAAQLADTNRTITASSLDGVDVSNLLDQRDQLGLKLAQLTGGTATVRADGGLDVVVGGASLVSGQNAARLAITGGVNPDGTADGSPVSLAVVSGATTTPVAGLSGEIGAVTDLLTTALPSYRAGLDAVAKGLADAVNAVHQSGYDKAGAAGGPVFSYTPGDEAASLSVAITDASKLAASSVPGGGLDGSIADRLGTSGAAEADYQRLVTGFGTEVASVKRQSATQRLLTTQIDNARQQLSGVNLDEEMVSMMTAQRGYEAAARVMTTVDAVLDTLINRTGITR